MSDIRHPWLSAREVIVEVYPNGSRRYQGPVESIIDGLASLFGNMGSSTGGPGRAALLYIDSYLRRNCGVELATWVAHQLIRHERVGEDAIYALRNSALVRAAAESLYRERMELEDAIKDEPVVLAWGRLGRVFASLEVSCG